MGLEAECLGNWDGKELQGRLLLEGKELLFRGDHRLKIPLATIAQLEISGGTLRLECLLGSISFDLGSKAEIWRDRILNPKSRLDKLGIKRHSPVAKIHIFDHLLLEELRDFDCSLIEENQLSSAQIVLLGVNSRAGLESIFELRSVLSPSAALWVIYPKGQKTITESMVMEAGHSAGFVIPKVCAFSETHTGLKLVIPAAERTKRQPSNR